MIDSTQSAMKFTRFIVCLAMIWLVVSCMALGSVQAEPRQEPISDEFGLDLDQNPRGSQIMSPIRKWLKQRERKLAEAAATGGAAAATAAAAAADPAAATTGGSDVPAASPVAGGRDASARRPAAAPAAEDLDGHSFIPKDWTPELDPIDWEADLPVLDNHLLPVLSDTQTPIHLVIEPSHRHPIVTLVGLLSAIAGVQLVWVALGHLRKRSRVPLKAPELMV